MKKTSCLAEFYVVDWRLCFLISKYSILKLTLVRFSKTCDIPCIFQFYISNICSNIAKILFQLSKLAPGFAQSFCKFKWITIVVTLSAVNIIWHSHLWVNNSYNLHRKELTKLSHVTTLIFWRTLRATLLPSNKESDFYFFAPTKKDDSTFEPLS